MILKTETLAFATAVINRSRRFPQAAKLLCNRFLVEFIFASLICSWINNTLMKTGSI